MNPCCEAEVERVKGAFWKEHRCAVSCPTHGDPLVCLSCEAEEDARPEWRGIARGDIQALYYELIYAVESKRPGESRHQTALRYIREHEQAG